MADILLIESTAKVCSVGLGREGEVVALIEHEVENSHSTVLTSLIQEVCQKAKTKVSEVDAIAVSAGPGSYTGLRIGVSTAKGLCYSLKKPLIAVDTLQAMASAVSEEAGNKQALFCPLLDARRMEVYTGIYDYVGTCKLNPQALIIDNNPFMKFLEDQEVYFFGSGADKCREFLTHKHSIFEIQTRPSARHMAKLANNRFIINELENIAYFEPRYIKAFYTPVKPNLD